MIRNLLAAGSLALPLAFAAPARAVSSAELYQSEAHTYGRFEARIRFAAGDGVISSFFLWKPGSELAGTFWNELDFEKLGADCRMQTNPLYGLPVADHGQIASVSGDLCADYHTYAFEWTPGYIAWLIDGVEVRREAGEAAAAFELNAASGMQIHFNLWPGDATFGGNFDPATLPLQQYISWVQYSSFASGVFVLEWREDFAAGVLPAGWATGNWASPKNYSTHTPANVSFVDGITVLSLTPDGATGFAGTPPPDDALEPGPAPAAGGSSSSGTGAPDGVGGSGRAATAGGAGGAAGTSNGATAGGAGAAEAAGEAGEAPAPALAAPGARSDSGCSLGTRGSSAAALPAGLLLGAGIVLSARHRRRARPAQGLP
jgi:hypothetical protein